MASPGPEIFARGFRFHPTPLEAATYYLPRLVAGAPLHEAVRPVVHHTDVYACEPGELARQFRPLPKTEHRFFFTHCKLQRPNKAGKASRAARAAGPGSWQLQSAKDIVDHANVKVGEIKKLRYKKGGAYTDWLMDEYSCCLEEAIVGDRQYVFCNIYVSPRAAPDSAARQESAAFFPQPAPVMIAQAAVPKRPAPEVPEPPCPKRIRCAVAPTPPVVHPAGCSTSVAPPQPYVHQGINFNELLKSVQALQGVDFDEFFKSLEPANCVEGSTVTRLATPAPAPPPKQQMPPPTPPVVRTCHMPVQAPTRPQPSEKTKQIIRDPFEAAELRNEAEEESVAAPDDPASKESPAAAQDFDFDEFCKSLEDIVPTISAQGSTMTDDEVDQFACLLENEIVVVPMEAIQAAIA